MSPSTQVLGQGLWMAGGLIAALCVVQFMLLPNQVARFRQRLFQIRRQLFLYMVDGGVASDHAAYITLQATLNGLLHLAGDLSLTSFFVYSLTGRHDGEAHAARWRELLAALPEETSGVLQGLKDEISKAIYRHVVRVSPVFWVVFAPVFALGALIAILDRIGQILTRNYYAADRARATAEHMIAYPERRLQVFPVDGVEACAEARELAATTA